MCDKITKFHLFVFSTFFLLLSIFVASFLDVNGSFILNKRSKFMYIKLWDWCDFDYRNQKLYSLSQFCSIDFSIKIVLVYSQYTEILFFRQFDCCGTMLHEKAIFVVYIELIFYSNWSKLYSFLFISRDWILTISNIDYVD